MHRRPYTSARDATSHRSDIVAVAKAKVKDTYASFGEHEKLRLMAARKEAKGPYAKLTEHEMPRLMAARKEFGVAAPFKDDDKRNPHYFGDEARN